MKTIFLTVSFFASLIGSICGIGGGIIIKPILDATGYLDVSSINFLSGITVLSMSSFTFLKSRKNLGELEFEKTIFLATGSVFGGIFGRNMFHFLKLYLQNDISLVIIQSAMQLFITITVILYIIFKNSIQTKDIKNKLICFIIGAVLGAVSSFLGIGGGPINIAILCYFFSMSTKVATKNSIFIILFSQSSSLVTTFLLTGFPNVDVLLAILMVFGGISGGYFGGIISKKLSANKLEIIIIQILFILSFVNVFNIFKVYF